VSAASEAYKLLDDALQSNVPECQDILLFTMDDLDTPDIAALKPICDSCPIWDACNTYARTARVTGGFWAKISSKKAREALRDGASS
jgi:hypothetical protein